MSSSATPEDAVRALEAAYRGRDLEAAVACKDFREEARLMLKNNFERQGVVLDEEILVMTAEVLELSYRSSLLKDGFPDFTGVISSFPNVEVLDENLVVVTEVCQFPDGGESRQRLLVSRGADGWRVLNPLDDEAA